MNKSLEIGQLEVTGSSVLSTQSSSELQSRLRLEAIHELANRNMFRTPTAGVTQEGSFYASALGGRGREGLRLPPSGITVGRSRQGLPTGPPRQRVTQSFYISVLAQGDSNEAKQRSGGPFAWRQNSLSDWASSEALTRFFVTHVEDDYMSTLRGSLKAKKLASFVGRVQAWSEPFAYVSLFDESTGERFEAECEIEILREKGIKESDEFLCTVVRKRGQTLVEFSPLAPKLLTQDELERISNEVDSRLH